MRTDPLILTASKLVFGTLIVFAGLTHAQTQPAQHAPLPVTALSGDANMTSATVNQPASKANQLIERISIEDASTRIDEVRFGGQTKSITVQPKGGMPAYDIQPETGVRTWKIFGY